MRRTLKHAMARVARGAAGRRGRGGSGQQGEHAVKPGATGRLNPAARAPRAHKTDSIHF
jgi:hypothetical protein